MATPAQAAATTVGAGSLAAAGAYGITSAVKSSEEDTTTENSLEDNTIPTPLTFATQDLTDYSNKFLSLTDTSHLEHLVKPENNEKWWDWAFKNKYKAEKVNNQFDSTFASLENSTGLSKACGLAYKKPKQNYSFGNQEYLLKNISAFCTKGLENKDVSKPKVFVYPSANTPSGYSNGVLSVETNRTKLAKSKIEASDQNNNNDLWWNWAFNYLLTEDAKTTATTSFKTLALGYKEAEESSGSITSLNNACNDAYKKDYAVLKAVSDSPSLINDIKRFCSIDPQTTSITLPEPANPSFVKDASDFASKYPTENSLVKTNDNKDKLVDPEKTENQNWWEWSFTVNYPKDKSRLVEPFNKVQQGYKAASESDTEHSSLNHACKTSYAKVKGDFDTTPPDKETLISLIKKFCSPTSVKTELVVPTKP